SDRADAIVTFLRSRGASFFGPLHEAVGGGYPAETVDALWALAWQGIVTNDTFHALRTFTRTRAVPRRHGGRAEAPAYRRGRLAPPSGEGRWSLVPAPIAHAARADAALRASSGAGGGRVRPGKADATKWAAAVTQQLLARHGVLTREAVTLENLPGGFGT